MRINIKEQKVIDIKVGHDERYGYTLLDYVDSDNTHKTLYIPDGTVSELKLVVDLDVEVNIP